MNDVDYNIFRFSRALARRRRYAFQVKREEFDELLFQHAASKASMHASGAGARVEFSPQGVTAQAESEIRRKVSVQARYLVDATGRDTLLGNVLKLKRKHPRHRSAALFAISGASRAGPARTRATSAFTLTSTAGPG